VSTIVKGAKRALIWLGVIIVLLYSILTLGVVTNKTSFTPGLGLDLAGGTTLILKASPTNGATIDSGDLNQAVEVIRRRIDATGVAEAEITTQGSDTIVIAIPGHPSDHTIDLIKQSAQLQFRPVLLVGDPGPVTDTSATPTPTPTASDDATASPEPSASATTDASITDPSATATPDATASPDTTASADPSVSPSPNPSPVPGETDPSSYDWLTDSLLAEYKALDCTDKANWAGRDLGPTDAGHVACANDPLPTGPQKLAMGPVELDGSDVKTASSGPEYSSAGTLTGGYQVMLEFNSAGAAKFADVTQRLYGFYQADETDVRAQFAILLDGLVISHPRVMSHITGGTATISGSFTQTEAAELANQLKFGAIPLDLTLQSNDTVSPSLGTQQLEKGLIAGAIGLLLVVIYSLFQYRALGFVTVGSLLIAGVITYGVIALLSWGIGYRLSLAGVAGLIIAIGITADSFIVYFERVKDELREGRSLQASIDHAWRRARRTILASDAVSFLAAVVLYVLAIGSVRGFAFTLGLTTLVDVIVVILFTHPVLVLLSRTKFFGEGHRFSGLDPRQLGKTAMYKGRGRVASAPVTPSAEGGEASGLTLAERKAAAAKGEGK
jgi:preprotein translocase subunit SecD